MTRAQIVDAIGATAEFLSALVSAPAPGVALILDGVAITADVAARQYESSNQGVTR